MKLQDLLNYLESSVPPAFQESYDNSGLQVGNAQSNVDSVLLCLDVTEEIIDEADSIDCRLIISHHPLIFQPLKRISGKTPVERVISKAILKNISIYSMHTNLDLIRGGVSYRMAEMLGMKDIEALVPLDNKLLKLVVFVPLSYATKVREAIFDAGAGHIGNYDRCSYNVRGEGTFRAGPSAEPFAGEPGREHTEEEVRVETVLPVHIKNSVLKAMIDAHPYQEAAYDLYRIENTVPGAGLGCVGRFDDEISDIDLIKKLGELFQAEVIRHTATVGRKIKKLAVMGGSGASYTGKAIAAGVDAFITSDIKYHSFFEADNRILLADIGHYESEKPSLVILHELITKKFPKFAVRFSEINTNPVNYSQAWKK
ncbi:MAG: Nif3-like dinuclear metal center hexameric protein [Bacteroidales bacterium]|nr:Nif3-like dinuclear metal center hexameric protein [Bacteroidales bacterium]